MAYKMYFILFCLNFVIIHAQQNEKENSENLLIEVENLFLSHEQELDNHEDELGKYGKYKELIDGNPVFLFRLQDQYICVTRIWTESPGGPWIMFWILQEDPIVFISKFKEPDIRITSGYWMYRCQKDSKEIYFFTVCIILNDPRGEEGIFQSFKNKETDSIPWLLNWDIRTYKIYNNKHGIEIQAFQGISGLYSESERSNIRPSPTLEDILSSIEKKTDNICYYKPENCTKAKLVQTKDGLEWED